MKQITMFVVCIHSKQSLRLLQCNARRLVRVASNVVTPDNASLVLALRVTLRMRSEHKKCAKTCKTCANVVDCTKLYVFSVFYVRGAA